MSKKHELRFTDSEVEAMGFDLSPPPFGTGPVQLDYEGTMLYRVDGEWLEAALARELLTTTQQGP